jgi:hypothetical protein
MIRAAAFDDLVEDDDLLRPVFGGQTFSDENNRQQDRSQRSR